MRYSTLRPTCGNRMLQFKISEQKYRNGMRPFVTLQREVYQRQCQATLAHKVQTRHLGPARNQSTNPKPPRPPSPCH